MRTTKSKKGAFLALMMLAACGGMETFPTEPEPKVDEPDAGLGQIELHRTIERNLLLE